MNIKSILRSRLVTILLPSVSALLLASCATDVASNPKLAQAAKWQVQEDQKLVQAQKLEQEGKRMGLPAVAAFAGAPPEAADPMVDTPYGRYRKSVLKRAIRDLEKTQAVPTKS